MTNCLITAEQLRRIVWLAPFATIADLVTQSDPQGLQKLPCVAGEDSK